MPSTGKPKRRARRTDPTLKLARELEAHAVQLERQARAIRKAVAALRSGDQ